MDQKVAAAAKRADGQAEQLQGAVEELEGRVVDNELLTRKTLDGWRGRPVLRREDLQAEMEKFAADRTGRRGGSADAAVGAVGPDRRAALVLGLVCANSVFNGTLLE